jgi:hypothetical protein
MVAEFEARESPVAPGGALAVVLEPKAGSTCSKRISLWWGDGRQALKVRLRCTHSKDAQVSSFVVDCCRCLGDLGHSGSPHYMAGHAMLAYLGGMTFVSWLLGAALLHATGAGKVKAAGLVKGALLVMCA